MLRSQHLVSALAVCAFCWSCADSGKDLQNHRSTAVTEANSLENQDSLSNGETTEAAPNESDELLANSTSLAARQQDLYDSRKQSGHFGKIYGGTLTIGQTTYPVPVAGISAIRITHDLNATIPPEMWQLVQAGPGVKGNVGPVYGSSQEFRDEIAQGGISFEIYAAFTTPHLMAYLMYNEPYFSLAKQPFKGTRITSAVSAALKSTSCPPGFGYPPGCRTYVMQLLNAAGNGPARGFLRELDGGVLAPAPLNFVGDTLTLAMGPKIDHIREVAAEGAYGQVPFLVDYAVVTVGVEQDASLPPQSPAPMPPVVTTPPVIIAPPPSPTPGWPVPPPSPQPQPWPLPSASPPPPPQPKPSIAPIEKQPKKPAPTGTPSPGVIFW